MVRKSEKKNGGRPNLGFSAPLTAHITPETKSWLAEMVRESGLREGEVIRRMIDDARSKRWSPI